MFSGLLLFDKERVTVDIVLDRSIRGSVFIIKSAHFDGFRGVIVTEVYPKEKNLIAVCQFSIFLASYYHTFIRWPTFRGKVWHCARR